MGTFSVHQFWMQLQSVSQHGWVYWESLCFLLFIKCWPCLSGSHLASGTFALQSSKDSAVLPFAPEICFSRVTSYDLISLLTIVGFKQDMAAAPAAVNPCPSWCSCAVLHPEWALCRLSAAQGIREDGYASKFINHGKAVFNKQRCDPA